MNKDFLPPFFSVGSVCSVIEKKDGNHGSHGAHGKAKADGRMAIPSLSPFITVHHRLKALQTGDEQR
jgi:hypothetical protein